MNDNPHPLTLAHRDLLATVDHLIKQLGYRNGNLAPNQIMMLSESADRVHAAKRAATSLTDILTNGGFL